MGNDEWLDEAAAARAARKRRERALTDRRRGERRIETPDALAAAGVFWEAFKTEVRRIVAEWNRDNGSDHQIVEGPLADHVLVLYLRDRMGISCTMSFAPDLRDRAELRVETKVAYRITVGDSGIQVGPFRSPEPLAAEVLKTWIGQM